MPFTPAPAELESAILSLKKELDAVILAPLLPGERDPGRR
jgi:hypothetical protein